LRFERLKLFLHLVVVIGQLDMGVAALPFVETDPSHPAGQLVLTCGEVERLFGLSRRQA
jgi:hypothetical protein